MACTHYVGNTYYGLSPNAPEADDLVKLVRETFDRGLMDDPAHLADSRVWLFHGKADTAVPVGVMETLRQFYEALGVREPKLQFDGNQTGRSASHGIPVTTFRKRVPSGSAVSTASHL